MTCEDTKPLLNARLDGELDPKLRSAVDSHVGSCPSCAGDLAMLQDLSSSIRAGMPHYRAPAHLRDSVRSALRASEYLDRPSGAARWKGWTLIAAAAVLLIVLGAAPFVVNVRNHRDLLAQELLTAHERALIGRDVDVVSSDRHTVKPWFNGKLPFSPPVIDLSKEGFPLEGGRLDYAGGRAIAGLVYGRRLHKIDVFVWPEDGARPLRRFDRNGYHEVSWTKDHFVFACVSDLNETELNQFAEMMRRAR